jgi:hypothetical protein
MFSLLYETGWSNTKGQLGCHGGTKQGFVYFQRVYLDKYGSRSRIAPFQEAHLPQYGRFEARAAQFRQQWETPPLRESRERGQWETALTINAVNYK